MRAVIWLGAALMVFGSRLWLILRYGAALPILDQWDIEGGAIFRPWLHGTLQLSNFFQPHNEHRLVCTKLLSLGLLMLNGQWDSRLEMVVNALLFTVGAVSLGVAIQRHVGSAQTVVVWTSILLWGCLPFAYDNTLWGTQSQFYFLIFFSIAAVWLLESTRPSNVAWWFGVAAAVLACFSMASGFVASFSVLLLIVIDVAKRRRTWRSAGPSLLVTSAIVALSIHYRLELPGHAAMKAASPWAWMWSFARSLSWPFTSAPLVAAIVWLPTAARLWRRLRYNDAERDPLLAIAIWVLAQAAVIAYGRGGDGQGEIASRYTDVLALGTAINVCMAARVAISANRQPTRAPLLVWSAAALTLAIGSAYVSYAALRAQHGRRPFLDAAEDTVRNYVLTHDAAQLLDKQHPLTHPARAVVRDLLDDDAIRAVLPAEVREPLHITIEEHDGFRPNGYSPDTVNPAYEQAWGSFDQNGLDDVRRLRTGVIQPRLSYLRIEVTGHLDNRTTIGVVDAERGGSIRLHAHYRFGPQWSFGRVRAAKRMTLAADDTSTRGWLAFREPREVGRWSAYAESLVNRGRSILTVGIMLIGGALLLGRQNFFARRNNCY